MQRVLGQLEVAEQADQGRKDPPRFRAINGTHFLSHLFSGVLYHDDSTFPLVAIVFQLSELSGTPIVLDDQTMVGGVERMQL